MTVVMVHRGEVGQAGWDCQHQACRQHNECICTGTCAGQQMLTAPLRSYCCRLHCPKPKGREGQAERCKHQYSPKCSRLEGSKVAPMWVATYLRAYSSEL